MSFEYNQPIKIGDYIVLQYANLRSQTTPPKRFHPSNSTHDLGRLGMWKWQFLAQISLFFPIFEG